MFSTADLAAHTVRHIPAPGMVVTAVPRLSLFRADAPTVPLPAVYEASLCLIAQGAKRVTLADESVVFDAAHYLVVSIDLPLVGHVTQASTDAPYLCCKIDFDLGVLADLVLTEGSGVPPGGAVPVLAAYPAEPELADAVCRLVRLIDRPRDVLALAPLIQREILYRLLTGPHGAAMRRMASVDSHLARIGRAIACVRNQLEAPLRVADLAAVAGMSPSSFHQHFKAVTRLTPLEYQKQLRLQEARRLMLAGASAGEAGFAVGYESPSQFSREYARLFGAPPQRDVQRLQASGQVLVAA